MNYRKKLLALKARVFAPTQLGTFSQKAVFPRTVDHNFSSRAPASLQ